MEALGPRLVELVSDGRHEEVVEACQQDAEVMAGVYAALRQDVGLGELLHRQLLQKGGGTVL